MKVDRKDSIQFIMDHYGFEHQKDQAQEGLIELHEALTEGDREYIIEGMATVHLMVHQMMRFLEITSDEIAEVVEMKVDRTIERIAEED